MKKEYINPVMNVVHIETNQMIASSPASPQFYDSDAGINEDGDYDD